MNYFPILYGFSLDNSEFAIIWPKFGLSISLFLLDFCNMPAHQSITDAQRQALRRWFKQQYPRPRQHDCIPWFEKRSNHHLSASTVSDILSHRYSYLDEVRLLNIPSLRGIIMLTFVFLSTRRLILPLPYPPTVSELRIGLSLKIYSLNGSNK